MQYRMSLCFFSSSENIIGLVNIRDFALLDTDSGKFTVRSLMNFFKHRYGKAILPDDSCYDVFNKLKKGNEQRSLYCDHREIF